MHPLDTQVGGVHYKEMAIQPVEYIHNNNLPFIEGCIIKYVSRWKCKGGIPDLKKARHFLDILIEFEDNKVKLPPFDTDSKEGALDAVKWEALSRH